MNLLAPERDHIGKLARGGLLLVRRGGMGQLTLNGIDLPSHELKEIEGDLLELYNRPFHLPSAWHAVQFGGPALALRDWRPFEQAYSRGEVRWLAHIAFSPERAASHS
jgi:hypothetical protein